LSPWIRLGELLHEQGYVSREHVDDALRIQARPDERRLLGQICVGRGYATAPQIQAALTRQHELLNTKGE
jgi:hypothetical protein